MTLLKDVCYPLYRMIIRCHWINLRLYGYKLMAQAHNKLQRTNHKHNSCTGNCVPGSCCLWYMKACSQQIMYVLSTKPCGLYYWQGISLWAKSNDLMEVYFFGIVIDLHIITIAVVATFVTIVNLVLHYIDVIMTTMASQITSLTVVYSTVYSDADQSKHQSSASLAFVWGIHRDRWIPRTKGQLRGKCFHLMTSSWVLACYNLINITILGAFAKSRHKY